jgi:pheromone shutdown protein TraB
MVNVYGTSHVSEESMDVIDRALNEHQPDIVALELDMPRLQSLLGDETGNEGSLFMKLLKKFQERVGQKTGVMPGDEMMYAYQRCADDDMELALIDQDIRVTFGRLKKVPAKEKVKAGLSLVFSIFASKKMDLSKIPEDETIEMLLEEAKDQYPEIYRVLVQERNLYMAKALKQLETENPEKDIVAFVGAGHKEEIRALLNESSQKDFVETGKE